jgi:hypothetical protein
MKNKKNPYFFFNLRQIIPSLYSCIYPNCKSRISRSSNTLSHSFGAGGVTDNLARLLAKDLSQQLGQPGFVENRPGASGITGSQYVANASADGYTLLNGFFI